MKVGFDKRQDTYTGRLAYVTYVNLKGETAKEKSWEGWRDKNIPVECFDNVATEGFVLNKKVGGYKSGFNHRQTYVRCYDPRGFEFEITVANLLFILENTSAVVGKGLEGSFVYGWDGKNLLLIPTTSQVYKENVVYSENLKHKKLFKSKDLVIGKTYYTKSRPKGMIYLGKYMSYNDKGEENGKAFFFARKFGSVLKTHFYESHFIIDVKKSLGNTIIRESFEKSLDFSKALDDLERDLKYSPKEKTVFKKYKKDEFLEEIKGTYSLHIDGNDYIVIYREDLGIYLSNVDIDDETPKFFEKDPVDFFEKYQPSYSIQYLKNGKIYSTSRATKRTRKNIKENE